MIPNIPNTTLKKIAFGLLGLSLLIGVVGTVKALNHNNSVDFGAASVNVGQGSPDIKQGVTPTDKPTASTPTTTPTSTPTITKPTAPAIDVKAASAQVCLAIISNSKSMSDAYSKMFFDGWKNWNDTYAGDYTSQAALDSKQWTKDYIKKLFTDYINSTNPSYISDCGSGSVADILNQPNYDAWW